MAWVWAVVVFGGCRSSAAIAGSDSDPPSTRSTLISRSGSSSRGPSSFLVVGIWPWTHGSPARSRIDPDPATDHPRTAGHVRQSRPVWRSAVRSRPPQADPWQAGDSSLTWPAPPLRPLPGV